MNFSLSVEQRMLVDTVRRFVQNELQPLEDEVEETGALSDVNAQMIFEKSRQAGLYAMNMPEELGGSGLSTLDRMLVEEQFGHTSDILIRRAFGNVYEVLLQCSGAQVERWLIPAVRGERTAAIAISEPNAGSDAAGIQTRAVKSGDGWRLSGAKHFISDGIFSDFFIVSAVTDPEAKGRGISLFLVDKDLPGVTVGKDQKMMGLRGTPHVELFFDQVPLEPIHLLGNEGQGLRLIFETLGQVRLAQIGARAVGKSCHVHTMMVDYARQREQFGQPIGNFQLIQQMIADNTIEINAARLLILQAAYGFDQGHDVREMISMVKVQAAETLGRVVDRAVQVFGGMGYCKELPIERYYRDARIYRIYDGTSEIHRTVVARGTLKHGAKLYDLAA
ncbi:MAG: acyl-CoA dehydrogenase family protein [Chloroflexota bacterium]